jgi:hypothetical protein
MSLLLLDRVELQRWDCCEVSCSGSCVVVSIRETLIRHGLCRLPLATREHRQRTTLHPVVRVCEVGGIGYCLWR